MPKSRFTTFRNGGSGNCTPRARKYPATSKASRYVPAFRLALSYSGPSGLRPSAFRVKRLTSVATSPCVSYKATAMPAAGAPCMVSRTCVLNPIGGLDKCKLWTKLYTFLNVSTYDTAPNGTLGH